MERLTGLTLLAHHNSLHHTTAEKVRLAGYVGKKKDGSERIYFTAYYEEVLKIKNWQKRQDLSNDRGGAECIKTMLFYAENRANYKKGNDEVTCQSTLNFVTFWHHKKIIAILTPECVVLYGTVRSKSTKERLNRILMRFCGCQLYQRNKVWYVYNPMECNSNIQFKHNMKVERVPAYTALFPV